MVALRTSPAHHYRLPGAGTAGDDVRGILNNMGSRHSSMGSPRKIDGKTLTAYLNNHAVSAGFSC